MIIRITYDHSFFGITTLRPVDSQVFHSPTGAGEDTLQSQLFFFNFSPLVKKGERLKTSPSSNG